MKGNSKSNFKKQRRKSLEITLKIIQSRFQDNQKIIEKENYMKYTMREKIDCIKLLFFIII